MILNRSLPAVRHAAVLVLSTLIVAGCVTTEQARIEQERSLARAIARAEMPFPTPPGSKLDSLRIDDSLQVVRVFLSREFAGQPVRQDLVDRIHAGVRGYFGDAYQGYRFEIQALQTPVEELIPNYFRAPSAPIDQTRLQKPRLPAPEPVVLNTSRPDYPSRGLQNRNILLWHSHGWYFNNQERRWEWQRPRLFQSVEDLGPLAFTLPYLVPMLENAGARVFLPRERDTQTREVIIDNDMVPQGSTESVWSGTESWTTDPTGFRAAPSYAANVNPFLLGTSRWTRTDATGKGGIRWIPAIPATGAYAVSIAYPATDSSTQDARFTVRHTGGVTEFRVNQRVGGNTWHHLGTFTFHKGVHPDSGSVTLTTAASIPGQRISADAVRFGGGMGVIERDGAVSGRPRYAEGARYYLQFAGMPDTLVYNLNGDQNDYRDDYQSRAEYGNYLTGAPAGPNRDRTVRGLGIPIDLSLAFHTDAGVSKTDTTIGTLLIYSVEGVDSVRVFPDGVSRLANRDLADLMQTQIVEDIRRLHDPAWRRRDLRNADYSESTRPNFPGVLLELLSHQNFLDTRFMLDPQFRFDVARAIYKSMLRFLAFPSDTPYVVQPLAPDHLAAALTPSGGIALQWQPVFDPLEPTASPARYIVYVRTDEGGFDNGRLVETTSWTLPDARPGVIYSFQVCAVNDGGQSVPSEIVAACRMPGAPGPALIVNAFDRIAGPAAVASPQFAGFQNVIDAGVPDRFDYNFTGMQHDFLPSSPYRSNDAPGHGASFADDETRLVAGNSFDYPFVHGRALRSAGWSFVSCSDEAVMDTLVRLSHYPLVDLVMGEERATPRVRPSLDSAYGVRFQAFPPPLRREVHRYLAARGRLLVSGSNWASDLWSTAPADSSGIRFGRDVFRSVFVADHASRNGEVVTNDTGFLPAGTVIRFATGLSDSIYAVESAEAIAPLRGGTTLLRYTENLFAAAAGYRGDAALVLLGFPFETVLAPADREALMAAVIRYLMQ